MKLHCKTMRSAGFPGTVLLVNGFQFGLSVLELKCNAGSAAHCVCLFEKVADCSLLGNGTM